MSDWSSIAGRSIWIGRPRPPNFERRRNSILVSTLGKFVSPRMGRWRCSPGRELKTTGLTGSVFPTGTRLLAGCSTGGPTPSSSFGSIARACRLTASSSPAALPSSTLAPGRAARFRRAPLTQAACRRSRRMAGCSPSTAPGFASGRCRRAASSSICHAARAERTRWRSHPTAGSSPLSAPSAS